VKNDLMRRGWRVLLFGAVMIAGAPQGRAQEAQQPAAQASPATPAGPVDIKNSAGFKEFNDRVQKYLKIHKTAEGKLAKLKTTNDADAIVTHQKELAKKIKAARATAKRGEVFTPRAAPEFKKAIDAEFKSSAAPHAAATIHQGAPLKEVHLRVNQVYPENVPKTSVPPSLLLNLPKLPDEVVYRVVGRDFVLLDAKANLVVDLMRDVMPAQVASQE
jgi:hypothetical protein